MEKPTIVFVHGGCHDTTCWDVVRSELEKHSYDTIAVSLPGAVNNDPPVKSHHEDTAVIRAELERLILTEHKYVVLVMHSYGGVPGSESVKGLESAARGGQGGVVHCVYIAAALVPVGGNFLQLVEKCENITPEMDPTERYIEIKNPVESFYNDCPSDVAKKWVERLRPFTAAIRDSTVKSNCCQEQSVACSYLICEKDQVLSVDHARAMIADICPNGGIDIELCDSGHSPWISQVPTVVRLIRKAAGEEV